ncbi:MAG TPA: alpha/beta hydrolase [Methylomirabilota bacterium]|nr:alpha/beta hydrolase [Methylomirabilota bacterium]
MKDPVLVLIHGYPFDRSMWYPVVAALGTRVKALVPDLPGFGAAPALPGSPSMEGYADHIVNYLRSYGPTEAIFAGMSLGGYVALAIAEKYPNLTLGLGLVSSQAAADSDETREARYRMIEQLHSKGVQPAIDAALPKLFAPGKESIPELAQHPRDGAQQAGVAGLSWALEAMALRPDRTEFLSQFKKPVLIAHGTEDKFIPLQKARELAEKLDRPVTFSIPGAGHATPLEAPDVVANALARLADAVREHLKTPAT